MPDNVEVVVVAAVVVVVVSLTFMRFEMETDFPPIMKDTVPSSSSFIPSTTPVRVLLVLSLLSLLYSIVLPIKELAIVI